MAFFPRAAVAVLATLAALAPAQQPATIHVDLTHSLGPWKPITSFYGYDELNYTTTPNGRKLLGELARTSPLPVYIRAHHLLTTGDGQPALKWSSTNIYTLDAHGHPAYNFKIIDQTFDAWLAAGVRPMVELGFMPEALASGTNPYHLTYPHTIEGSVQSPPKDYAAWGELCRTLVAHLVARYGRDRVNTWYFEVWNEPNIPYWHGTEAEYLKLYDYAVAGVRSALPTARVGGPATTSPRDQKAADYLAAFLNHIAHDKSAANGQPLPLDFITFHAKGSPTLLHEAGNKDTPTTTHVRMGLNKELTDADRGFSLIASYPQFHHLPIILSEADPEGCAACSAKENPANGYRNGPLYAAYNAAVIKGLFQLQDKYNVNLVGMLSWSFEFEGRDYFEGFRTLATNGIDKPILNLFRMTGQLSGTRVETTSSAAISLDSLMHTGAPAPEIDALATNTHSGAEILVWNYQDADLPNAAAAPMDVDITGLPASVHNVKLQAFAIDRTHSNSFTAWQAMGSPQHPTPAQYKQLEAAGQLQSLDAPHSLPVDRGHITISATLPAQATVLYSLSW